MLGKLFKVAAVGWMALKWYRSRNGGARTTSPLNSAVKSPFERR